MTLDYPAGLGPPVASVSIAELLPSILAPLGVPGLTVNPRLDLSAVDRTVVLVVDGLGLELLLMHGGPGGEAVFLASLMPHGSPFAAAAFPTSTAVSVTSIGTGLHVGAHGMVGYTMAVPEAEAILECLSWRDYRTGRDLLDVAVPEELQPSPTLAERATDAGVDFVLMTYEQHERSGLTRVANRGARFVGIPWQEDVAYRLRRLTDLFSNERPIVVSTYYAGLDIAGHREGVGSDAWHDELAKVDDLVRRMADLLPAGSRLIVTADHGMVDLEPGDAARIDLASRPALAAGLRGFAGDPRMRHLYTEPGERTRVADRWRTELDGAVWIVEREVAIDDGWFGPTVRPEVVGRIGDLLALAVTDVGIFDSRIAPHELPLVGHHGSLRHDEVYVPAIVVER